MFQRILIAAWVLYLSTLALLFLSPHLRHLLRGHGRALGYALTVLGLITFAYWVRRLYRAGMARAGKR